MCVNWLIDWGSDEELTDLKAAYTSSRGDMDKIIDSMLCATVDDEPRFRHILENLIADGSIRAYTAFTNEKKAKSVARKRKVGVWSDVRVVDSERESFQIIQPVTLFCVQHSQSSQGLSSTGTYPQPTCEVSTGSDQVSPRVPSLPCPGKSWNFLGYDVGSGHSDAGADDKICEN